MAYKIKFKCPKCDDDGNELCPERTGAIGEPPLQPCRTCGGAIWPEWGKIPELDDLEDKVNDVLDKVNDVLDKLNDILEKLNE